MDVLQIQKDLIGMQDYMKNFARTLTKDEADAEDLTQDTTLRVLNNYDKFVDNVNFKGWVLKIMRNIFINNYHKLVRTQSFIDPNVDAYNVPLLSEGGHNTPEALWISRRSRVLSPSCSLHSRSLSPCCRWV